MSTLDPSGQIGTNSAVIIDDYTTANIKYICFASPGTLSSSPYWRIMIIDSTAGKIIKWANGDTKYDNIADNRTALTYL